MSHDVTPDMTLATRAGLPDALRILQQAFPREIWEGHGNFGEMVQFWLQRHAMFREVMRRLVAENEAFLDGRADAGAYAPRLSQMGGFFLNQLHSHHGIEDAHYFPQLIGLEPRLSHGFEMLETDHAAIDGLLHEFATAANAVLSAKPEDARAAAGGFHKALAAFAPLLERHLTDEEDLIVPVILKSGFQG